MAPKSTCTSSSNVQTEKNLFCEKDNPSTDREGVNTIHHCPECDTDNRKGLMNSKNPNNYFLYCLNCHKGGDILKTQFDKFVKLEEYEAKARIESVAEYHKDRAQVYECPECGKKTYGLAAKSDEPHSDAVGYVWECKVCEYTPNH